MRAAASGLELTCVYEESPGVLKIEGHSPRRLETYWKHYQKDTDRFYKRWAGYCPPS